MSKSNSLTTNRFVIRKSLVGQNAIITFTNKKGDKVSYNHDDIYNTFKVRFDSMNCFVKYKSYTNSNCIPAFARSLKLTN